MLLTSKYYRVAVNGISQLVNYYYPPLIWNSDKVEELLRLSRDLAIKWVSDSHVYVDQSWNPHRISFHFNKSEDRNYVIQQLENLKIYLNPINILTRNPNLFPSIPHYEIVLTIEQLEQLFPNWQESFIKRNSLEIARRNLLKLIRNTFGYGVHSFISTTDQTITIIIHKPLQRLALKEYLIEHFGLKIQEVNEYHNNGLIIS